MTIPHKIAKTLSKINMKKLKLNPIQNLNYTKMTFIVSILL